MSVLIIGASVAGIRTVQALRGHGYDGTITVLGAECEHPYDKPPLTKDMLAEPADGAPVPLLSAEDLAALEVDLRLGTRAVGLDPRRRVVSTEAGGEFNYGTLVVATGVRPRPLPGVGVLGGVYTIRDVRDARALRTELPRARRVVVIGAGFIGAEFASAVAKYGVPVSVVEVQQTPLAHLLGAEVGAELARLHALNGVELLAGERFSHFVGEERVAGVALGSGRMLPADLAVVGIGAVPATDWLADSGLPIENGIRCDENLRVPGFPGIYAAGDIALRQHPIYGDALRIEHWTNAGEHAAIVAADITGAPPPRTQLPYVWSDQYGRRIQIVGRPGLGHLATRDGAVDSDRFVAVYADVDGIAIGAVVVDDPRALMMCRRAIARRQTVAELEISRPV